MWSIGKVFVKSWKFEWKIDNFFSYTTKGALYRGPDFDVRNSHWFLKMVIGEEYVSLYVDMTPYVKPTNISFKFGIKTVDHAVVNERNAVWNQGTKDWGLKEFIKRSELRLRKSMMVPLGTLTIICFMKEKNNAPDLDERHYKLATDFKDMFTSKKNTDLTIKVKKKTFYAHKFCLAARSPVLTAMLENEMIEKRTGLVSITDCDPKAFNSFLIYLYSGDVNCAECDVFELYKIADKYDVSELKLLCVDFMIRSLCVGNFCDTYVWGHEFNENELLTSVQRYFEDNFEEIVSSAIWANFLEHHSDLANKLLKGMAPKIKIKN